MRHRFARFLSVIIPAAAIAAPLLLAPAAMAQDAPAAAPVSADSVYIVDDQDGGVILDKNSMARSEPASLTKMMTAYLAFAALKEGRIKLTDKLTISRRAAHMGGSRMFIERDAKVAFEDLLRGVIVQSGNDASVAIAEGLAGSEDAFVAEMNAKAREFGMLGTHFANASGWPDPDHYTTARDLAILAHHLIADFPEDYHYFSELDFTYRGIRQGNRNPLLYKQVGADGIKTGFAEAPGYSLVASGVQDGRRLIMVVQGLDSKQSRSDEALRLWQWAFRNSARYTIAKAGVPLAEAPVWLGEEDKVPVGPAQDVVLTLPRTDRHRVKVTAVFDGPLAAPIAAGQVVGKLRLETPGATPREVPLIATSGVKHLGTFGSMIAAAEYLISG